MEEAQEREWQEQRLPVPEAEEEQVEIERPSEAEVEVTPMAASASFYLTINCVYPAGATQIGQATTYQVVTPWGQSTACICLDDALNQVVASGSQYSGQMGNYLNNGVTRGLTTTSATVPVSASYFQALP